MLRSRSLKVKDRFFQNFAGAFVKIYTKSVISESVSSGEHGSASASSPLSISGFLLDVDEQYYYIGEEPTEATAVVRIDQVVIVEEIRVKDGYDAVLESVQIPHKKTSIN